MMPNMKEMELKLTRSQVCDIELALTGLRMSFEQDARDAENDESKERAERSAKKWERLHDLIKEQLNQFDEENK